MAAKPLTLLVLSHDGKSLGYYEARPVNGSWRALGMPPRIYVPGSNKKASTSQETRPCERHGDGWALRLAPDGQLPKGIRLLDTTTQAA